MKIKKFPKMVKHLFPNISHSFVSKSMTQVLRKLKSNNLQCWVLWHMILWFLQQESNCYQNIKHKNRSFSIRNHVKLSTNNWKVQVQVHTIHFHNSTDENYKSLQILIKNIFSFACFRKTESRNIFLSLISIW